MLGKLIAFLFFGTLMPMTGIAQETPLASGIATRPIHLEQYTTLLKVDSFPIYNTGAGPIQVTDITSTSPDMSNGYITCSALIPASFPINIPPNDSIMIVVTFNPRDLGICRRNFVADLIIQNSTGTPITNQVTARGHEIDMHSYIDERYWAYPLSYPVLQVIVDTLRDTLGQSDICGFIFEMTHYHRTVLSRGSNEVAFNTSGNGAPNAGYATNGASFAENMIEDGLTDSTHSIGEQGYFEFNVANAPQNLSLMPVPSNLFDVRFKALVGWDTSVLNFVISNPIERTTNAVMKYVNSTMTPGFITIDSLGPCAFQFQISPNPTSSDATVNVLLPSADVMTLEVFDEAGRKLMNPISSGLLNKGFQSFHVNLGAIAAGAYYCKIHSRQYYGEALLLKVDGR